MVRTECFRQENHKIINCCHEIDKNKKCLFIFKNKKFTKKRKVNANIIELNAKVVSSKSKQNNVGKLKSMPQLSHSSSCFIKFNEKHSDNIMFEKTENLFGTNFKIKTFKRHKPTILKSHLLATPKMRNYQIYRCSVTGKDNCCCCCNSDLMFEVMNNLYECYRRKNCDNCECLLCSHLSKDDKLRRFGLGTKAIGVGTTDVDKDMKTEVMTDIPSVKLEKAKAAGLITPLEGKSKEEKEKILRGLANLGIPLPTGKTPPENKLIDKIRKEFGLPPDPKSKVQKENFKKALDQGLITPLKGKTNAQKEKILKGLHELGLPLPEGRTASEKKLVAKIRIAKPSLDKKESMPSDKTGSVLKGKTLQEKDKYLRDLAQQGQPLPKGDTVSEQKLIAKIKKDLGPPLKPPTDSGPPQKADVQLTKLNAASAPVPLIPGVSPSKMKKAKAAGFLTPLDNKTQEQKEKILKGLAFHGIPLPEGNTTSNKNIIDKVRRDIGLPPEPETPDAKKKYKMALGTGLIAPLMGKTPAQKEKILLNTANAGLPLPEGTTPSEKQLINKNRFKLGLPPVPKSDSQRKRMNKAYNDGIILPLLDKSRDQKEKILTNMAKARINLPEGRTPSEKDLIRNVKLSVGLASNIPSEKLIKAKNAGLLTPIKGKPKKGQERILKGRIKLGLPLPKGSTPSEKKLILSIKKDIGYTTPESNEKLKAAKAAGFMTPLEGKTDAQKKKIIRGLLKLGLPLPEGKTSTDKKFIQNVVLDFKRHPADAEIDRLSKKLLGRYSLTDKEAKDFSKKLQKAKAANLLNPLEGKNPKEKERKLKGLARMGIPLPEGKMDSEKELINKVIIDLGLPPSPKSSADRKKYQKAYALGILTPLQGKSQAQKRKILIDLAKIGIPLPQGRTNSEKDLIIKIHAQNLSPTASSKSVEGQPEIVVVGVPQHEHKQKHGKRPQDIIEIHVPQEKKEKAILSQPATAVKGSSGQDIKMKNKIVPTDVTKEGEGGIIKKVGTCEKSCGCATKRIRFKHSYVKIKVTSPDMSSICPCPKGCIPEIKNSVVTDEEGIKVTVGRIIGYPKFNTNYTSIYSGMKIKNDYKKTIELTGPNNLYKKSSTNRYWSNCQLRLTESSRSSTKPRSNSLPECNIFLQESKSSLNSSMSTDGYPGDGVSSCDFDELKDEIISEENNLKKIKKESLIIISGYNSYENITDIIDLLYERKLSRETSVFVLIPISEKESNGSLRFSHSTNFDKRPENYPHDRLWIDESRKKKGVSVKHLEQFLKKSVKMFDT